VPRVYQFRHARLVEMRFHPAMGTVRPGTRYGGSSGHNTIGAWERQAQGPEAFKGTSTVQDSQARGRVPAGQTGPRRWTRDGSSTRAHVGRAQVRAGSGAG